MLDITRLVESAAVVGFEVGAPFSHRDTPLRDDAENRAAAYCQDGIAEYEGRFYGMAARAAAELAVRDPDTAAAVELAHYILLGLRDRSEVQVGLVRWDHDASHIPREATATVTGPAGEWKYTAAR